MKLEYAQADLGFRDEVRAFLRESLPPELAAAEARHGHLRRAEIDPWQKVLAAKGWAVPSWPASSGGPGWTPVQRHLFDIEYGRANGPEYSIIGVGMVGPVIDRFGSDAIKDRYLQPIIQGDLHFCQGFSEPGAGSDLASLKTRAARDGGDYVVTGQKTWTSHAAEADYMICLARTNMDVKPQAGLSMLLIPMRSPGVTVRPIPSIDGVDSINEVFLEDVRVPADALIGEPDKGWEYAKFLLNAERTHNAYLGVLYRYLDRLRALGSPSQSFNDRVEELATDIEAHDWSVLRVHSRDDGTMGGATASAIKVTASHLLIRAGDLELEAMGLSGIVEKTSAGSGPPDWMDPRAEGKLGQFMYWRASTIYGGANEIQRMIIWNMLAR